MARKPPIFFQNSQATIALDEISKGAWVDLATQLVHVIHGADPSIDLQDPDELAGLLLAYAAPVLQARGDTSPLRQVWRGEFMETLAEHAATWDVPAF